MSFNTVGIIVNPRAQDISDKLSAVIAYLHTKTCTILLDESTQGYPDNDLETLDRDDLGEQCDLVITLGGDGTILNAARSLANKDVPLLGINLGRLGFLADVLPSEFEQVLDDVFAGNYQQEQRFLFSAEVRRDDAVIFSAEALNDVVVHVRNVARMIEFETRIDGVFVNHQRADGLIVATPTGSTAYALSSGGPILHTDLEAISLVPICPHTLSSRPLVVSANSVVEILVCKVQRAIAQITCDGQQSLDLCEGDTIHIRKKSHVVTLLHPSNHDYYQILRAKLRWSEHLEAEK